MIFILDTLIWVFAIYGLIEIIKEIINISKINDIEKDGIKHIILVKDQEKNIEGYLRTYILKKNFDKIDYNEEILLIDLNSADNTKNIIKKLQEETKQIRIIKITELEELINKFKY